MPAKTTSKKTTSKKGSAKKAPQNNQRIGDSLSLIHFVVPFVLIILSVFMLVCLFFTGSSGFLGKGLNSLLLGSFGGVGYALPVVLTVIALYWRRDARAQRNLIRILLGLFFLLGLSSFVHSFSVLTDTFNPQLLWSGGNELTGGGVLGGLLGSSFYALIGKPGLIIVSVALTLCMTVFFFGITLSGIAAYLSNYFASVRKEKKPKAPKTKTPKAEKKPAPSRELPEIDEDYEYTDDDAPPFEMDEPSVDPEIFERIKNEINGSNFAPDDLDSEDDDKEPAGRVDLEDVFNDYGSEFYEDLTEEQASPVLETEVSPILSEIMDSDELSNEEISEEEVSGEEENKEEEEEIIPEIIERPYVFPPISLLPIDKKPATEDVTEELRSNATKLVDTLASFKVRTKIIDISRGPTITRYELAPEEGVRVRQIANLVDDISLSLASSGIRIEAPIPGKAAVGIEVPNKVVATVYLRELIENPTFVNAKSKITVSLGMDVAGAPVFVDIAKMPHLLIAGATGMGKSVCINSMIVSLLYKASPEEVKLILIDPKKVEFNVYNGLPHLLIPVVSDPKKAAGALHWAVAEMERRFQLIENVGVRNITNFNEITKDDPTYDFMPHVVIVIDELADLMMTAPDEVEDSICRLAQKARAAGMHIIIGTQRPSVDVITGLIKANIPSRIACTVASQVDSRTILDTAGAEKLIGRGDMLYAPVGAAKPIRVQGAYVDEKEVEAVTDFIRSRSGESEYDSEVIEKIEKEAAKCGVKKGSGPSLEGADDDEDADPMFKNAIELAVDSGKISTSLIQRKLSLGYGRAAKLIDRMEKMGIVGAPEGNKPREVLISRAEFLEMTMNSNDQN